MLSLTSLLIAGVFGIVIYKLFFSQDGKNYPKGPFALPFIGNVIALGNRPEERFMEWSKKYGDVFQVFFGKERCIVITDLKLAKEVFNDPVFSGRPHNELFHIFSGGPVGVLNSSGQVWLEQRRFTLRHLRDFGFGKNVGEELIMNEINEFLKSFSKDQGTPVVINRTFQAAVLNTLWEIMAGVRYEQDDPRLWSIFKKNKELLELMGRNPVLMYLQSVAKRFPELSGWNQFIRLAASMKAIVEGHVQSHNENIPEDGESRDFIDVYMKEIENTSDVNSSFYKKAGATNLNAVIGDLFGAGFDTVTTTISWATLFLVKHREIQKKFQDELDKVVGRNGYPALADRSSLPYVEAVIAESMRAGTIVPNGLFHAATQDAKIRDYDVPKGSWILAPLHGFHNDEQYFPKPKEFIPERFLSPDGKTFRKHEALVPFAFGKRVCLGETLARDEVFLFVTNMFHRYNIIPAPENPDPSVEYLPGFLSAPQDYKVLITERS